jgi:hypothetical protein
VVDFQPEILELTIFALVAINQDIFCQGIALLHPTCLIGVQLPDDIESS